MNITLALTSIYHGAHALNYVRVDEFIKNGEGKIIGAHLRDTLSNEKFDVQAKVFLNRLTARLMMSVCYSGYHQRNGTILGSDPTSRRSIFIKYHFP